MAQRTREELLNTRLNEMQFVFAQMHVRMQANQQYIAQGLLLFTVIVGFLVVHWSAMKANDFSWPLLLIPIPFGILGLLQLREDILLVSHDRSFMEIRASILKLLDLPLTSTMLGFLNSMYPFKSKGFVFSFLSLSRYFFSLLGVAGSLVCFVIAKEEKAWRGGAKFCFSGLR